MSVNFNASIHTRFGDHDNKAETLFSTHKNLQGRIPQCQMFSDILGGFNNSKTKAEILQHIQVLPNERYNVLFEDATIPVHKDEFLKETGNNQYGGTGDIGVKVLEVAHAKLLKYLYPEAFSKANNILDIYTNPAYTAYAHKNGSLTDNLLGKTSTIIEATSENRPLLVRLLKAFANNPNNFIVTAASKNKFSDNQIYELVQSRRMQSLPDRDKYLDAKQKIAHWHMFTLLSVNPQQETVTLRDPREEQPITLSFDEFFNYFKAVRYSKVG